MSVNRCKYDAEFKKNAVKLSYASPKTVKAVAEDLGISESMLYAAASQAAVVDRQQQIPR